MHAGPLRHVHWCLLGLGMGWLSHPGAILYQPVRTGSLQTGVGRSSHDRLKSLGPNLQQSIGHLPSVYSCVPCSFRGLVYCCTITVLWWVLPAIWFLPLPTLPASGYVMCPSLGGLTKCLLMSPLVRRFSQRQSRASNIEH